MEERYVGTVISRDGQLARVKIEQVPGRQGPKLLDCWNACEAKKGTRVLVERQSLEADKAKLIVRWIPILTAVAGAAFGRAVAHFLPLPLFVVILGMAAIWFLLGLNYTHNFKKAVKPQREQWTVTGYYTEGELPNEDIPEKQ